MNKNVIKWHASSLNGCEGYIEGKYEWGVVDDGGICRCSTLTKEGAEKIALGLNGGPRYSSVISNPSLHHKSKETRECAKFYAEKTTITIEDLLFAIESLHSSGRYDSHPYIQLHGDGSGSVIGRYQDRLWGFCCIDKFYNKSVKMLEEAEEAEGAEEAEKEKTKNE